MNIGVIVDNEFSNDIRVLKEVDILNRNGHKVFVLCFGYPRKTYASIEGVTVERIPFSQKKKDIFFLVWNRFPYYEFVWKKNIKKFIVKYNIDILHAHDMYMAKSTHQAISNTSKNCPLIIDLHENYPAAVQSYNWTKGLIRNFLSYPEKWKYKEEEYLSYASHIIVLSDAFKLTLCEEYPSLKAKPFTEFPNVINFNQFENFRIDPNEKKREYPTLLYFGAVAERRGIFDAIEATRQVLKDGIKIKLLIIGPVDKADKNRFMSLLEEEELEEYIEFIPWIKLSELVTYLHISDICLAPFFKNPQHESGVANKIFQYMYGKKPIIASNCGPQERLIESFNCGLIYSSQEEFVEKIKYLVLNPKEGEAMGMNGYRGLYEKYNSESYEGILLNLYKEINSCI